MDNQSLSHLWMMRAGFVVLALTLLFFHLLPLETTPRRWAGPDLLTSFAFAWVLRRPEYIPVLLVGALFLLADFMLQRPPGLQAGLALIAFESLRIRAPQLRDMPFSVEWAMVATAMIAMAVATRLIHVVLMMERPALGIIIIQLALCVAVYPIIVGITRYAFGIQKATLGEINALGQRQ